MFTSFFRFFTAPLLAVAVLISAASSAAGESLAMPTVFGSHMVLQQGQPIQLWGTSEPGGFVVVTVVGLKKWGEPGEVDPFAAPFVEQQGQAAVGTDGKWSVTIPAIADAGHFEIYVSAGQEQLIFENVLLGQVFAVSGVAGEGVADGMTDAVRARGATSAWGMAADADTVPAVALVFGGMVAMQQDAPVGVLVFEEIETLVGPTAPLGLRGIIVPEGAEAQVGPWEGADAQPATIMVGAGDPAEAAAAMADALAE